MTGAPRMPVVAAAKPPPVTIDTAKVFTALGKRGKASGAVASLSFALISEPVMVDGAPVLGALAYGTPISIQQVSPTRAVATGDFSVLARQLQPVLRALAANGITATAVHNHLVNASPNVYYTHFWVDGPLDKILVGLKAALDAAKIAAGANPIRGPTQAGVGSLANHRPPKWRPRLGFAPNAVMPALFLSNAHPRTAHHDPHRSRLDPGSRQADADEQPRPRCRREARRTDRLWRTRQGGAQLGCIPSHHRDARPAEER